MVRPMSGLGGSMKGRSVSFSATPKVSKSGSVISKTANTKDSVTRSSAPNMGGKSSQVYMGGSYRGR